MGVEDRLRSAEDASRKPSKVRSGFPAAEEILEAALQDGQRLRVQGQGRGAPQGQQDGDGEEEEASEGVRGDVQEGEVVLVRREQQSERGGVLRDDRGRTCQREADN